MLQQTPAAARIASPQVRDNNQVLPHEKLSSMPPKKRQRDGAEPPKKRRREEQRGLCELNIDELYIIFTYIYPMDLLNLARTCKSLRAILMHKSSRFLWEAALRQVEDLPPCPADLTEPEYTNLIFYTRCHVCGKSAQTILWNMRRRYCPACRVERLCRYSYVDGLTCKNEFVPNDRCKIGRDSGKWVDRDQMNSFVREYQQSSDKRELLNEKRKQYRTIHSHASECEYWQKKMGRKHRHRLDMEVLREERGTSIIERLKQRGYGPEIAYFGCEYMKKTRISIFFKRHDALTNNGWDQIWPELVKIMNNLRKNRLETTLYQPRRHSLASEYKKYVTQRSPDTPTFDLLPHVVDLARFTPFQDIIMAPEEAQTHEKLFASAFAQLPVLVGEWKKQLDIEVAELVKIPPHLPSNDVATGQVVASSSATSAESHQMSLDKLHLACALFHKGGHVFTYPEVLLAAYRPSYPQSNEHTPESIGPLGRQLGVEMLEDAPYIVHACGLDPSVATVDDMDRRNARLRCLRCVSSVILVVDWRSAMLHARDRHYHRAEPALPSEPPRWQLINDEHIDGIQAVEKSLKTISFYHWKRCLLCHPRIGDALNECELSYHLKNCHNVNNMKRGVHYKHMGVVEGHSSHVEMVEEGGQVIFRRPQY